MDLTHPDLKYLGEALCLLGIAYRLLRWVWRTKAEVDGIDPGSFWSQLVRGKYSRSNVTIIVNPPPQDEKRPE